MCNVSRETQEAEEMIEILCIVIGIIIGFFIGAICAGKE